MKKVTLGILTALTAIFAFGGCEITIKKSSKKDTSTESSIESMVESVPEESQSKEPALEGETPTYLYNAFTPAEKALFETYIGEVIPFCPNNEYYVEGYYEETDYENGMCFCAMGAAQEVFDNYRNAFVTAGYTFTESYQDGDNDTWYCYEKGDLLVEMCYYFTTESSHLELFVCIAGEGSEGQNPGTHLYNAFDSTEVALFETYVGEVIPFIPNNEYYVEGYYEETDYENGMCFYTIGNTQHEFDEYRAAYLTAGYTLVDTYQDNDEDTWYCYEKGDLLVEMCYYDYDGETCLEVYVTTNGETGGDVGGGDNTQDPPVEDGDDDKPTDAEGTRVVDFTKATNVKNVTDQGSYLGGCPTTGKVKVLVIPVEFMDCTAKSKGYEISKIDTIFNGASGTTDYFSVKEYYSIASYGKLDLEFEVVNSWFKPKNVSSYYNNATMTDEYGEFDVGDMLVMNEALAYLESRMDLSKFDSDKNGMIDAVVMINTVEIDSDDTFNWAFRYWNYYTDQYGEYYQYDGVTANDYIWASYQFIMESYDRGTPSYSHSTMNPYTYIHEFGHVLGADDYYDFSGTTSYGPMEGYDVMDAMTGDHNAFTKFNYGWVTSARLITAEDSVTLTMESFTETGDAVLIASNWSDSLGAYQEYYLVVYYTNTGLNTGEGGYFDEEGILVFHVNATLIGQDYYGDGEIYYDLKYNNAHPDSEYGTDEYLIEIVDQGGGNYVYGEGKSLSANTKMDNGTNIPYVFTVNDITEEGATVTFRKNA